MSKKQISLHARIEQEAIEYANQFKYGVEYRKAAYIDGAASYIVKLQAAEEKAARYEKALKEITTLRKCVGSAYDMQRIASDALTPKTGE